MKAFILAAGFGTRLDPHTQKLPKPLFTIESKPVIAYAIESLVDAGCTQIVINTHHLHDRISRFVDTYKTDIDITVLHEPEILDTGGAIANAKPYFTDAPFFVVNADILSDIDLARVYRHHIKSKKMATLLLHHCEPFNKVSVDSENCITGFDSPEYGLAFTGVQVLSPGIFNHFPDEKVFSSISVYKTLCRKKQVAAFIDNSIFWSDIGTPDHYIKTSMQVLSARHFNLGFSGIHKIEITPLAGDGSDRHWFRASYKGRTVIVCSHGICIPGTGKDRECRAFIKIGGHLNGKSLNIPKIYSFDRLSGIVLVEDLGDTLLQSVVQKSPETVPQHYQKVIDHLILFSRTGAENFNPDWTCQTARYDKELILEKECRYFIEAFVNRYLGQSASYDDYKPEFEIIADQALTDAVSGLMHRDMQSRNIMVKNGTPWFVDFQSARRGPIQYDLASLLIDPYVDLDDVLKKTLLNYAMDCLDITKQAARKKFTRSYTACCLTRNLQALGAYGYLTSAKGKKTFEQYIPCAVKSLKSIIREYDPKKIPMLSRLVDDLKGE